MIRMLKNFAEDRRGATAIEYGLIAALVSVAVLTVLGLLGDELETTFTTVKDSLATGNTTGGGDDG